MTPDKPHLTLVNEQYSQDYLDEFIPLPYYPWDERPSVTDLSQDEVATALLLAHGDEHVAAKILKTPFHRVQRMIRASPKLQRVHAETHGESTARAASVAIQTLYDPAADRRALEWASTKVLQMKMSQGSPYAPAPAANIQSDLTISAPRKTLVFRWRTDADDLIGSPQSDTEGDASQTQD